MFYSPVVILLYDPKSVYTIDNTKEALQYSKEMNDNKCNTYYCRLRKRIVRPPTNVLTKLIDDFCVHASLVEGRVGARLRNDCLTFVEKVHKRCSTHPDDVRWKKKASTGHIPTALGSLMVVYFTVWDSLDTIYLSKAFRSIVNADPSFLFIPVNSLDHCINEIYMFDILLVFGFKYLSKSDWIFLLEKMKKISIQDIALSTNLPTELAKTIHDFLVDDSRKCLVDVEFFHRMTSDESENVNKNFDRVSDVISIFPEVLNLMDDGGATVLWYLIRSLDWCYNEDKWLNIFQCIKLAFTSYPSVNVKPIRHGNIYELPLNFFTEKVFRMERYRSREVRSIYFDIIYHIRHHYIDVLLAVDFTGYTTLHWFIYEILQTFERWDSVDEFFEYFTLIIRLFPTEAFHMTDKFGRIPRDIAMREMKGFTKKWKIVFGSVYKHS